MSRSFSFPGATSYIQGEFCLQNLGNLSKKAGTRAFILAGETAFSVAGGPIQSSLDQSGVHYTIHVFHGFCSPSNIDAYSKQFIAEGADFLIGVGGGRAIDTAKGVALKTNAPFFLVPTSPSQCACCANVIILYDDQGDPLPFSWNLDHRPLAVFADTDILARRCPARMLAAGTADAMAKLPEIEFLRSVTQDWQQNPLSSVSYQIARDLYALCLEKAAGAAADVRARRITQDVEDIITANILLAGLSSVLAAGARQIAFPHNIYYAICRHYKPQQAAYMHGEMVSVGLAVQLLVNGVSQAEVSQCLKLLRSLQAPALPQDLNLTVSPALLDTLLAYCARQMPYLTPQIIAAARSAMESLWECASDEGR